MARLASAELFGAHALVRGARLVVHLAIALDVIVDDGVKLVGRVIALLRLQNWIDATD